MECGKEEARGMVRGQLIQLAEAKEVYVWSVPGSETSWKPYTHCLELHDGRKQVVNIRNKTSGCYNTLRTSWNTTKPRIAIDGVGNNTEQGKVK